MTWREAIERYVSQVLRASPPTESGWASVASQSRISSPTGVVSGWTSGASDPSRNSRRRLRRSACDVVLGPGLGGSLSLEALGPYASLVVAVAELPALATPALVWPTSVLFPWFSHDSTPPTAQSSVFERRRRAARLREIEARLAPELGGARRLSLPGRRPSGSRLRGRGSIGCVVGTVGCSNLPLHPRQHIVVVEQHSSRSPSAIRGRAHQLHRRVARS